MEGFHTTNGTEQVVSAVQQLAGTVGQLHATVRPLALLPPACPRTAPAPRPAKAHGFFLSTLRVTGISPLSLGF